MGHIIDALLLKQRHDARRADTSTAGAKPSPERRRHR
jgi:hypothetical protein